MKKTVIISVFALCAIAGSFFLYVQDNHKSHLAHTVMISGRPYQPLDGLRIYFGHIGYGGHISVKTFVHHRFPMPVLVNLSRIRFDAPGTPEFEMEPELQYFHPKGGGQYGVKTLYDASLHPYKEVLPKSKMIFTFGNKFALTAELKENYVENLKAQFVKNPEWILEVARYNNVTVVVTHIRPEMCPHAEVHDVSLLPWPRKPKASEVVDFEQMNICYEHPDGWFYFIASQFFASYEDVQNYERFLNGLDQAQ